MRSLHIFCEFGSLAESVLLCSVNSVHLTTRGGLNAFWLMLLYTAFCCYILVMAREEYGAGVNLLHQTHRTQKIQQATAINLRNLAHIDDVVTGKTPKKP